MLGAPVARGLEGCGERGIAERALRLGQLMLPAPIFVGAHLSVGGCVSAACRFGGGFGGRLSFGFRASRERQGRTEQQSERESTHGRFHGAKGRGLAQRRASSQRAAAAALRRRQESAQDEGAAAPVTQAASLGTCRMPPASGDGGIRSASARGIRWLDATPNSRRANWPARAREGEQQPREQSKGHGHSSPSRWVASPFAGRESSAVAAEDSLAHGEPQHGVNSAPTASRSCPTPSVNCKSSRHAVSSANARRQ